MPRKPRSSSNDIEPGTDPAAEPASAEATSRPRERIIEAFMELLGEQRFERIALRDIAERAGVSLAELRGEFGSKFAILAAHIKEIDRQVLAGDGGDMTDEPTRERLFDVLMRRFEALAPYKDAIRSLLRSARGDPALALTLNNFAVNSMQWMLAGAEISTAGPLAMVRAQGLALLYANVMSTFLDDHEPGHAKTMAALDRALGRGQQIVGVMDTVCRFVPGSGFGRRASRPLRNEPPPPPDEDMAAAV
ncbi:Transcriptional regulator, TetR family [Rhodovulum sp. PH10]|uniref:TetR/AcrR family transcriptional regulator n=1 Tax=Rhodovulum sp. PH10 TaxID=1187851 RepID=UPI00027C2582|nr:TetR/AcrR family transcriptional regulator [Rhodovulum sp. PH10]EJW10241.1 Transcriptional regulator, TetR family [Rhodovulum sp. PH10]